MIKMSARAKKGSDVSRARSTTTMGHGIPSVLQARGYRWRVTYGIPKGHRCKSKDRQMVCSKWASPQHAMTCWACKKITLHPALLKASGPVAWRIFFHELLHVANWGVAHEHIVRLERIGEMLYDSGLKFAR